MRTASEERQKRRPTLEDGSPRHFWPASLAPAEHGKRSQFPCAGNRAHGTLRCVIAGISPRFRPTTARLVQGVACIGLVLLIAGNAETLLRLRQLGDSLSANTLSGLRDDAMSRLLARVEFVLLALGLALLQSTRRALGKIAPSLAWMFGSAALVTLALLVLGTVAIGARCTLHHGHASFFLKDDAMIVMRYAKNVAGGLGPVYNAGERVEGYSDPLWMVALSLVHLARPSAELAPLAAILLAWGCLVATVWASVWLLEEFGIRGGLALAMALAIAVDTDAIEWALGGLEVTAVAALSTFCAWALASGRKRTFTLCLSLIPLIRSDGLALATALAVVFVWATPDRRSAVRVLALAAIPAAAYLAFRLAYFGEPLPNTYYLKVRPLAERWVTGIGGFGLRVAFLYAIPCLLAAASMVNRSAPAMLRALVAVAFSQLFFGVYVGGDVFVYTRFLYPVLPLLFAGAAFTLRDATRRSAPLGRTVTAASIGLTLPIYGPRGVLGLPQPTTDFSLGGQISGELIQANVPRDALTTITPAGTAAYYAIEHRFVDVLGKNDAHIAHTAPFRGLAIAHNRFDFDYVFDDRRPEVAFVHDTCENASSYSGPVGADLERTAGKDQPWEPLYNVFEIAHPTFRKVYAPNRVKVVGPLEHAPLGCFFVREGSHIPQFWSRTGPPPPLPEVTLSFGPDDAEERVLLDPSFESAQRGADGRTARRVNAEHGANVDLWMERTVPLVLGLCVIGEPPESVRVNDVRVALSWDHGCAEGHVPVEILERRFSSTRITLQGRTLFLSHLSLRRRAF